MSIRRVHRIFDIRGRQTSYYDGEYIPDSQSREYRTRSRWGSVNVDFERRRGTWRLSGKYAYWG
ncbi:MAG: hypothetical protein M3165_07275 [Actinomycetota bacterium]|nr:hypothetical protein [Actinomycetota bacterium]